MKPAPFAYSAPTTLADALTVLGELGEDAKVLAGGQSLVPLLALRLARFEHLVDLNRIPDLRGVRMAGSELEIGAMTRQAAIEADPTVRRQVPLLARATPLIGHFQIRNRGTIGGSLAHADPSSEYPAVALALDATLVIRGPSGERVVDAAEFFTGTWSTRLEPDEILTSVRFPAAAPGSGFAIEEVARRAGDFAVAGAAVSVTLSSDGSYERLGIGLFGVGAVPVRPREAEAAIMAGASPGDVRDLLSAAIDPVDDVHATARYRRSVACHLVERAVGIASEEARTS